MKFLLTINDTYCRDISLRVRSHLDVKRKEGQFIGSFAGYGYRKDPKDKNHLIIDEYAAGIVQEIFKQKLNGMSSQRIARHLNELGVLPPNEYKRANGFNYTCGFQAGLNQKWTVVSVNRILKNESYTGTLIQGKRRKINYKVKKSHDVGSENWIRVEDNKYKTVLEPFLKRMPDKTFHYVASYMLKGYAMEKKGIAEKYRATSYKSLKRKISSLSDILDNAYGKSYCQISNPTLIGNVVNLGIANANKRKSRAITHSFGMKLRALMLGKEVEITFCDVQRTKKKYKFTDEERLSFVLFGILYASRCNNFHGNVAARMNSINANKDTFKMYTDMFLTEYIILAIHLNSQGALPDMVLNKVKENANLMV